MIGDMLLSRDLITGIDRHREGKVTSKTWCTEAQHLIGHVFHKQKVHSEYMLCFFGVNRKHIFALTGYGILSRVLAPHNEQTNKKGGRCNFATPRTYSRLPQKSSIMSLSKGSEV